MTASPEVSHPVEEHAVDSCGDEAAFQRAQRVVNRRLETFRLKQIVRAARRAMLILSRLARRKPESNRESIVVLQYEPDPPGTDRAIRVPHQAPVGQPAVLCDQVCGPDLSGVKGCEYDRIGIGCFDGLDARHPGVHLLQPATTVEGVEVEHVVVCPRCIRLWTTRDQEKGSEGGKVASANVASTHNVGESSIGPLLGRYVLWAATVRSETGAEECLLLHSPDHRPRCC